MINRQLFTMKLKSSRLKKFNYDIEIDYQEALENGEIVALGDNQILRTIRDVIIEQTEDYNKIKHTILDRDLLEEYYSKINKIKKKKNSEDNINKIKEMKQKIIDMCFIPKYITIIMEHDRHYDYLFENGLKINGVIYRRISTSAGQGRVSTVAFCSTEVLDKVNKRLDNGRDKNKKFSPSKFNAYKGTYGSATKVVTTPRFCVVPDYESPVIFNVNWVTETDENEDDLIEPREITRQFNRWDGMGLISPQMAKIWADDLGLDYIPAEFCIRQSFIKGMVCVFDVHGFCKKKNNGKYMVKSIYKDGKGNDVWVDLRNIDVIITESQFKLWASYENLEIYKKNCIKNNLKWGVSLYTDKELKHNLKYNYQFLQALDIKKNDIPKLCEHFINWIKGVNSDDIWYTLLFLMGVHVTEESIKNYLSNSTNYWIKSLIVNHDLINDKYIKQKIYNLIKTKIDHGCMGGIILDGNNQTLVSDPYAMMQYLCGHKVTGLLVKNEYYSNYWNEQNVKTIVGTRPPLTFRSEVTKLNLVNTEEQREWYKYLYGGIIVNIHGHETDNWAGSDWDFDFLSTTSNEVVVKSVYEDEYPVVYEAPKPEKIHFTEEDLYKCDKFTFGSIIGSITNKSTTGAAVLNHLAEIYGINSREYKTVLNRVKMCTKLQSAQIDKAKIGKNVKGIPKIWTDRRYIESMDIPKEEKDFLKSIMLDRHPYFFTHLYPDTRRKYKKHVENYNLSSLHKFGIEINELIIKVNKTQKEQEYVDMFYKYMPVIYDDCVMNNICRYIESVDFNIKNNIKTTESKDIHLILMRNENIVDETVYMRVIQEYKKVKKEIQALRSTNHKVDKNKYDESLSQSVNTVYKLFKDRMDVLCSNIYELVDYLICVFYIENQGSNKDLLWNTYGDIIFQNIKDKNQNPVFFPIPNKNGDIKYLNNKFELKEVIF